MKIEVCNLTKMLCGRLVLNHIDIIFANENGGKVYVVHGMNGSGKTMLMRTICGLVMPTQGSVRIDGKVVGKQIDFPPDVGLMLGTPVFIDEFTGMKNLQLLCNIKGKIKQEHLVRTMRRVGLDPNDRRSYQRYSLQMRQKLGIAAAITENPALVILDEPFYMLDEQAQALVKKVIGQLKRSGALIILICHDKAVLESLADEIVEMSAGKIVTA